MGALFLSSRALPATVAVAGLVLGLKLAAIVVAVPALANLGSGSVRSTASATGTGGSAVQVPRVAPVRGLPELRAPATPGPVLAAAPAPAPLPAAQPRSPLPAADPPLPTPDALKVRRSQTDEREQKLAEREAMMVAADKRLVERIGELTTLQARLQALEAGLKERDDANWAGMVKTYEAMRPRDAAAIFNALDKPVLLDILDRMKPAKATPVIAAMDPEKARQATADLSERRTRSTTVLD